MVDRFAGKIALITGAGGRRGIGRATALRLASEGADVAVLDFPWPQGQHASDESPDQWSGVASVADEIRQLGRRALALHADISNEEQVEAAVQKVYDELGPLDVLVANASARPGADRVPVVELPLEELQRVINVNLIGTFLCCKSVGKRMISHQRGDAVVIVSSQSGHIAKPRIAAYGATKFAQLGLTQAFAQEMGPYGVRVNAACPGVVDTARLDWSARATGLSSDASIKQARDEMLSKYSRSTPLSRIGTPEDVAAVVAFLASSDAAHMTGQSLLVDGGGRM